MLLLMVIAVIAFHTSNGHAAEPMKIQDEVIEASPLSAFSERAALWPVTSIEEPGSDVHPLYETLNSVPGVQAREVGSPTFSIRGSASSDRVLLLYEGIPVNLGDGLGGAALFIPEEAIGSVDLIKGPASVFYGTSAMAGALNHHTRGFSGPALRFGYTDSGAGWGKRSLFAVAPSSGGEGQVTAYFQGDSGRFPYSSLQGSGIRDSSASETARVTTISHLGLGPYSLKPTFLFVNSVGETPGAVNAPSHSTFSYQGLIAAVEGARSFNEKLEVSGRISTVAQWGLFDRGTAVESNSSTSRAAVSVDARATLTPWLRSRTFLDARHDQLQASYLGSPVTADGQFEIGESLEFSLTPTLSLVPVARYLAISGTFVKALALTRSDPNGRQWLTYSEGFRQPSLSDLYTNVSYFRGNPNLLPERSKSLEFGVNVGKNTIGDRLSFSSSLFIIRYDNLVDTTSLSPTVSTRINTGRALSNGVEASLKQSVGSFAIEVSSGYIDGRNEDTGESLRLTPHQQTRLNFSGLPRTFRNWNQQIVLTSWSSFTDRDPTTGAMVDLPSWTTVDVNLTWSHFAAWEIKASVLNLFDQARELTLGYPEPGRRIAFSAQQNF